MLNKRHSNKVFFSGVEPDARYSFTLTEFLIEVGARHEINRVLLTTSSIFLLPEHFEIILENVDDFIGLKSFFYSVLDTIDKFIKFFIEVATCIRSLTNFFDKIFRSILYSGIYRPLVNSLGLMTINGSSSLESD